MKGNLLILTKTNMLVNDFGGGWVVLGNFPVNRLADALEEHGADEILVKFNTIRGHVVSDKRKMVRRMHKLFPLYRFSGWKNYVHGGYTFEFTFVGTLTRAV